MMGNPTKRMKTTPLANVIDYCKECKLMKHAVEVGEDNFDLAELRYICTHCKTGKSGIFKADAIFTALSIYQKFYKNRNTGKKTTIDKTYGNAVKNLRKQKKTIKEIADILQISPTSVQKIINMQKPNNITM
jgi:hypothetical protein